MPRRIQVENHLSVEQLGERFKVCSNPTEKTRWQMVWLIAKGRNTAEVAEITGVGVDWVRKIVKRFNQLGPDGIADGRKDNGGQGALLTPEQIELLREALNGPAPDGGLWNSPKVARWIGNLIGRDVGEQRGWDYLQRLGFRLRRPRRRHTEADEQEQESF